MVLYKRKQVQVVVNPIPDDLSREVWYIAATQEWFDTYDEYLERMDYYHKRKFVCEITGNSCLTFFEALDSEIKEFKDVENNFPEALKVHILRFLQFNRITRLDQLVDGVYLKFKNNYFPGEYILLKGLDYDSVNVESHSIKQRGVIREKVEMADKPTSYLVVRSKDNKEAIVTDSNISRDRNNFTKYLVKTFIKLTMTRSHKIGAPWVLKNRYAIKYNISQEYPRDLQRYQSTTNTLDDSDSSTLRHFSTPEPVSFKHKDKLSIEPPTLPNQANSSMFNNIFEYETTAPADVKYNQKFLPHYLPFPLRERANYSEEAVDADKPSSSTVLLSAGISYARRNMDSDLHIKFDIQNSKPIGNKLLIPENAKSMNENLVQLIDSPQSKTNGHIESIDIGLQSMDGEVEEFPVNKNITNDQEDLETDDSAEVTVLDKLTLVKNHLTNIQEALESWIFINIYHKVLNIDTFTFDDFLYAMGWNQQQYTDYGRSELLDEIWCSVIGAIVSNKTPKTDDIKNARAKGEVFGLNIKVPPKVSFLDPKVSANAGDDEEMVNGSESEAENARKGLESDDDDISTSDGEKSPKKNDIEIIDAIDEESNDLEVDDDREHNAYQVMNHHGIPWHERLRKRNYRDGNWQTILLGILSLVEHVTKYKSIIDKVYKILAPVNKPATANTILKQFYSRMDINLRLAVLNILCLLLGTSNTIRNYIELGLSESSKLRKDRLDVMKEERIIEDKARKVHDEIVTLMIKAQNIGPDLEESFRRKLRFNYGAFEMNGDEQEISVNEPALIKLCTERKELLIEFSKLRDNKKNIERKLAEYDCQRLRCLGKDRLYNRYWWFENNGLPTLHGNAEDDDDNDDNSHNPDEDHDSDDEPLDETYLMGRLWVQGPSIEDASHNLGIEEFADYDNDSFKPPDWKQPSFENPSIKELVFENLPLEFVSFARDNFGLGFDDQQIRRLRPQGSRVLINKLGVVVSNDIIGQLAPFERKIIEECPDPLMNGKTWRYYDTKEDIEAIIRWLNPYGYRESQLKKSLLSAKDAIIHSIEARNKAFANKERLAEQDKLNGQLLQIDNRLINYHEPEEMPEEEDDDLVEIKNGRKRNLRAKPKPIKRQKKLFEEVLKYGDTDELQEYKVTLQAELQDVSRPFEFIRVSEWVNSFALEEFGKSLYDGGDKPKNKR